MVSADAGPRCCELIVRNLGLYKNIISDVVVLQNALDAVAGWQVKNLSQIYRR